MLARLEATGGVALRAVGQAATPLVGEDGASDLVAALRADLDRVTAAEPEG